MKTRHYRFFVKKRTFRTRIHYLLNNYLPLYDPDSPVVSTCANFTANDWLTLFLFLIELLKIHDLNYLRIIIYCNKIIKRKIISPDLEHF